MVQTQELQVAVDRRSQDRRNAKDRRKQNAPVAVERRMTERRKVQRRRQIDPTTCERDYSAEEIEFMQAMDAYKRASGRMFPTCSEILEVLRSLGYQRSALELSRLRGVAVRIRVRPDSNVGFRSRGVHPGLSNRAGDAPEGPTGRIPWH